MKHGKKAAHRDEERARPEPNRIRFLAHVDRDGDEKVSFEEFSKGPLKIFKRIDRNGDGTIDKDEAEQMKDRAEKRRDRNERMKEGCER